jgi:hypothetical protein
MNSAVATSSAGGDPVRRPWTTFDISFPLSLPLQRIDSLRARWNDDKTHEEGRVKNHRPGARTAPDRVPSWLPLYAVSM